MQHLTSLASANHVTERPMSPHELASGEVMQSIDGLEIAVRDLESKFSPALSMAPMPQDSPIKGVQHESEVAIVSNLQSWARRINQLQAAVCQIHSRCAL